MEAFVSRGAPWWLLAALIAFAPVAPAEAKKKPKRPDLVVKSLTVGTTLVPGQATAARDTTRNAGKAKAKPSTTVYVLSADKRRDRADLPLASRKVKGLGPRKAATGAVQLAVPAAAKLGPAFVLACADGRAKVKEAKETNNCRASAAVAVVAPTIAGPGAVTLPGLTPTPAPTPGPAVTPTPTATPTATPTVTPTPTPTPTPPPDLTPPPDPADVATAVVTTESTTIGESTEFLYTGDDPIQENVEPGTIRPTRVAVLRGSVRTSAGDPLPGVLITVLDHPEFGYTVTRVDGGFDMAVNGGENITLDLEHDGFMSLQRNVEVPWQDFVDLDPAVMTPYDSTVTTIDPDSSAEIQVAEGGAVTDADGTRSATLMFEQGTDAVMELPDGSTAPLDDLEVRATEYTVAEDGQAAMPGDLPTTSAYTYAVEFSVDEAVDAGATDVRFTKPVISYVDNFLGFPAGASVPTAYYDEEKGAWVPSKDGLVIDVLSEAGGVAAVDVDGDGQADGADKLTPIGLDQAELERLAAQYVAPVSLWRVEVKHFTPWDYNWPYGCEAECDPPDEDPPPPEECPECEGRGSIVGYLNQSLGERVSLTGTPFALQYSSDRMEGYQEAYTLRIPLTGASVKPSLQRVDLKVTVAGQEYTESFTPAPNLSHTFTWDGNDAYGRAVQGAQPATVRIGYVYPAVYLEPDRFEASFGQFGGAPLTADRTRNEITVWQEWERALGTIGTASAGLGGWTLDVHHSYDPQDRTLYLGNGVRRTTEAVSSQIETVAGIDLFSFGFGTTPATQTDLGLVRGVDVGPDGSVYIAETDSDIVRRVTPAGDISVVAGGGDPSDGMGDGGAATAARLAAPSDVEVGEDGVLYIADTGNARVRRVRADGQIETVAGGGDPDVLGDDGPATAASLHNPRGLALAPDGTLYVADSSHDRVRRITPDGRILTAAGGGSGGLGDGGPAVDAELDLPVDVALDESGTLFIADALHHRVRAVTAQGVISTAAGDGGAGSGGNGGQATAASIGQPQGIDVSRDGTLYIADRAHHEIRRVTRSGVISRFAGTGSSGGAGDGGPPLQAGLSFPQDVATAPDGSVLIADAANHRVRRAAAGLPGFTDADFSIPSADGSQLYQFDQTGRHLRTVSAISGATILEFGYDTAGRLVTVADGDGLVTTIARAGDGTPQSITSPGGRTTALTLSGGLLTGITDPAQGTTVLTYHPGGLLKTFQRPGGGTSTFTYDAGGRLVTDEGPDGQLSTITVDDTETGSIVEVESKLGRTTVYETETLPSGTRQRTTTDPAGATTVSTARDDGSNVVVEPDGTTRTVTQGPDPRWGMVAPVLKSEVIETPGGRKRTLSSEREVDLAESADLLSLVSLTDRISVTKGAEEPHTSTTTLTAPEEGVSQDWVLEQTTAEGRVLTRALDNRMRVIRDQVPGLEPTTYEYDARGRYETLTAGSGDDARQVSLTYTAHDEIESVTDSLGRTATFAYDDAGRPTQKTAFDGSSVTTFGHDADGRTTSLTPPGRPAHERAYTPGGFLDTETLPTVDAEPDTTDYGYNLDGDVTTKDLPGPRSVAYGYDTAGRQNTVTLGRGTLTSSFEAGTGRLTGIAAPGGIGVGFGYDGGVATSVSWTGPVTGSVERVIDDEFRTATRTVNGGDPVAYAYDDDSLLEVAGALTLTRAAGSGLPVSNTLDSITETWTHDGFGGLESITAVRGGTTLHGEAYVRDLAGRITSRTETLGGETHVYTYDYDTRGRLKTVERDGNPVDAYTYDANGNRLTGGGPDATYDAQDRLVSRGTTTYGYSPEGQLTTKDAPAGVTTYDYDELGNLLSVALPGGQDVEYLVDGQGRRIGKKVDGTLEQGLLWEGQLRPAAELDGAGSVVSRFVYATRDNVPDYMVKGGATYRLLTDHLGSVRLVVNAASGAVAQRIDYDAYGRVTGDTSPGFQPFGFAGGLYDPDTGLVRFGVRDYDAEAGRFTTRDLTGFAAGDTNLYAYVSGDPVNFVDPQGLWPFPTSTPGQIKDWATERTKERWPDDKDGNPNPSRHNGEGDAFRHCLGSCETARQYGQGVSKALGEAHELRGDVMNDQERGEEAMDLHNNKCGRKAAEKAKSAQDCEDDCAKQLASGELKTYEAGTTPTFSEDLGKAINEITSWYTTPFGNISVGWW